MITDISGGFHPSIPVEVAFAIASGQSSFRFANSRVAGSLKNAAQPSFLSLEKFLGVSSADPKHALK
jgi:hypothetical protein